MPPPPDVSNPFAAADASVLYDRGRPFHHPRTLERVIAMVGTDQVDAALDIACGTRMSTVAFTTHASQVVGVDVSPEMLRAARRAPEGLHSALGRGRR